MTPRKKSRFVWWGFFFLCLFLLNLFGSSRSAANWQEPSQFWYGELDDGSRVFRFIIEQTPAQLQQKRGQATLTSLDEGNTSFALSEFAADEKTLQFKLKSTQAIYAGNAGANAETFQGKWKQRGANLDLEFKKVPSVPLDEPIEAWVGTLKAGFQNLIIQVRGYKAKDGTVAYFVDSVSQKVGGFKATVVQDKKEFQLTIPAMQASYTGTLNESEQEIVGKWKQSVVLDLTFKRVDKVTSVENLKPNRPQQPKEPFPYEVRDVTFRNEKDGIELAGTLTVPKLGKSLPLAILISGSGPQDRDETILEHKPFWVIADHLSRNGIAVLRFDDRGVGKSEGLFSLATTADFAKDTQAAVEYARTLPEIDSAKIGLIGHSEGGLIAPMVAANDASIAWIILMAGPGVNGEEILYSQGKLIVAAEGGSLEAQEQQLQLQKATFEVLKDTDSKLSKKEKIKSVAEKLLADKENPTDEEKESVEKQITANWNAMSTPWFRFFVKHEPGSVLEKIQCPVIAMNGALDTQVDPKLNLPKIEEHLKIGGNTRFAIREFPSLNHMFQTCKTGGISEYESIEETISPDVLNEMLGWIQAQ